MSDDDKNTASAGEQGQVADAAKENQVSEQMPEQKKEASGEAGISSVPPVNADVPADVQQNGGTTDGDENGAEPGSMSFWSHLEVLRWSLFRVIIALLVCVVGTFIAMPHIFDKFILGPTTSDFFLYRWMSSISSYIPFIPDFSDDTFSVDIININVASQFMTHITTSFWLALVLVFPYLIFEIWNFIRPALFPNEKKNVGSAFLFATLMFFLGCAIGYCLVFPFTFRFLTQYQISPNIVNQINLNSYIGNFLMMIFVMGAVFELPLLAWLLSKLGILHKPFLQKYRRHAIVVLLVLAAIITPSGDPFTLMLVFVPLYILYEVSVCIVRK